MCVYERAVFGGSLVQWGRPGPLSALSRDQWAEIWPRVSQSVSRSRPARAHPSAPEGASSRSRSPFRRPRPHSNTPTHHAQRAAALRPVPPLPVYHKYQVDSLPGATVLNGLSDIAIFYTCDKNNLARPDVMAHGYLGFMPPRRAPGRRGCGGWVGARSVYLSASDECLLLPLANLR